MLCGICGDSHNYLDCNLIKITKHMRDKTLLTRARQTLPDDVNLQTLADGTFCVCANIFIEKGTKFGPLEAQKLLTLNPSITFPLKLFNHDKEDFSEYYLDTEDEDFSNWLIFVPPAQSLDDQNLLCFQEESKIFYVALKDINVGEMLNVWYSPYYATKMRKDVLKSSNIQPVEENIMMNTFDLNQLLNKQQNIMNRDKWICKICGKLENDISEFASHMLEHYGKRIVKKHCEMCKKSFETQKSLKRHIKSVHDKETPDLLKTSKLEETTLEKVKNKDVLVGGPLLNDLLTDSFDNTNLVLPSMELNQFSNVLESTLENQLLEGDTMSLNVDNLLTENVKELDHFNFEIDESQEQYVCDICLKSFTKLPYLVQHLRKHTGTYTCRFCLTIFCRKENLKGHNCTYNTIIPKHTCNLCQRKFLLRKHLLRHVKAAHEKKFTCKNCNGIYTSAWDCKEHNCPGIPDKEKTKFSCVTCNKNFFRLSYLKKHSLTHFPKDKKKIKKQFVCEICAKSFNSAAGFLMHKRAHIGERCFACPICKKEFSRQDVLRSHMVSHSEPKVTCSICNTKMKTKNSLKIHMRRHTGEKPFKCSICSKAFPQQPLLNTHVTKEHSHHCKVCKLKFDTKELLEKHKHTPPLLTSFICPVCDKKIKLKSSLRRHLKHKHKVENTQILMDNIKKVEGGVDNTKKYVAENVVSNVSLNERDNVANAVTEDTFENMVNNFDNIISDYEATGVNFSPNAYDAMQLNNTNSEGMLDFNDFEIDLDSNFDNIQHNLDANNREVCLSMPDLMETDQEITLGENAYMLEDGTIVEPKDQGNVLVYILGEKMLDNK